MGVFDRIELTPPVSEHLPNYDADRFGVVAHEVEWQTKSLEYPSMARYRITADGSLERYNRETEPIPEDEWTAEQRERARTRAETDNDHPLSGMEYQPTRTANEWWERLPDWHGAFSIYSSFDSGTESRERWQYDIQFVHGTLSRIIQTQPIPENNGVVDFDFENNDDGNAAGSRSGDHTSEAKYADELIEDDGKRRCPASGCSWWVPSGMEYLYDAHRIQHLQLLSGEMEVCSTTEGYSGSVDIEVWGTPTENNDPGTVTIDIWDTSDDQHASIELRIKQAYARELGIQLIEAAGHAREAEILDVES